MNSHSSLSRPTLSAPGAWPILFVHVGPAPYLLGCLAQARHTNPDSPVVLLGSRSNRFVRTLARHELVSDYDRSAQEFARVYRHFSTHAVRFELVCFQRWFVIEEFMRRNGIEQCFIADTDVLLYGQVQQAARLFADADMTLAQYSPGHYSGHYMFLYNAAALKSFCDYLMACYTDDETLTEFAASQREREARNEEGGICDMTLLSRFKQAGIVSIHDTAPVVESMKFDQNIREDEGLFELDGNRKRIVWHDGMPYGILKADGSEVRMMLAHFNGGAKRYMAEFHTHPPPPAGSRLRASLATRTSDAAKRTRITVGKLLERFHLKQRARALVGKRAPTER